LLAKLDIAKEQSPLFKIYNNHPSLTSIYKLLKCWNSDIKDGLFYRQKYL